MKLILASASPRRAEILRNAGIDFEIRAADIDETRHTDETPGDYVRRLALAKAQAVSNRLRDQNGKTASLILGVDTTVAVGKDVLGKPATLDDARRMLRRLSGQIHRVHTGVALLKVPGTDQRVVEEVTRVRFASLKKTEIEDYIATGEPFDKAGGYAIQGVGGRYITGIVGCYFNVMGLPLALLWSLLTELGWPDSNQRQNSRN
jgi:septum formation protein